jgi:hypothetical protein
VIKRNRIAEATEMKTHKGCLAWIVIFAYGVDLSFCYHWSLTLKIV